jgi:hypothetical protein
MPVQVPFGDDVRSNLAFVAGPAGEHEAITLRRRDRRLRPFEYIGVDPQHLPLVNGEGGNVQGPATRDDPFFEGIALAGLR